MSVIDPKAILNLKKIGGDKLLARIITLYLQRTPEQLGEITEAAHTGDYEILERVSHSMKSSAGNVGAARVYELAGAIEQEAEQTHLDDPVAAIQELKDAAEQAMEALAAHKPTAE